MTAYRGSPAYVPPDWCPGLPPAERIARLLLDQRAPELRYDVVDTEAARARLSNRWPGHVLPDVMVDRDRMLEEETARVNTALGYLIDTTGLAIAALEAG